MESNEDYKLRIKLQSLKNQREKLLQKIDRFGDQRDEAELAQIDQAIADIPDAIRFLEERETKLPQLVRAIEQYLLWRVGRFLETPNVVVALENLNDEQSVADPDKALTQLVSILNRLLDIHTTREEIEIASILASDLGNARQELATYSRKIERLVTYILDQYALFDENLAVGDLAELRHEWAKNIPDYRANYNDWIALASTSIIQQRIAYAEFALTSQIEVNLRIGQHADRVDQILREAQAKWNEKHKK